jgi:hypothetical protein
MNGPLILHRARLRFAELVGGTTLPLPEVIDVSPWVAMSLLQKAVRPGRTELAFRPAATLLQQSPELLWRRLACIAFEDVGLGEPTTETLHVSK